MPSLQDAADALIATVARGGDNGQVHPHLRPLVQAFARATPEEQLATMGWLGSVVAGEPWLRTAGFAALAAGMLVEFGAPPEPLAPALLARLPNVLAAARGFVDRVLSAPDAPADEGVPLDGRLVPPERIHAARLEDPEGGDAWLHLRHWCLPSVTLLSMAAPLRAALAPDLAPLASALAESDPHARYLSALLRVLDDAPLLVLHRASGRAWRMRVDGVADNHQLHVLLAGALAPFGLCAPPDPEALATATGTGAQDSGRVVRAEWDLGDGRSAAWTGGEGGLPGELRLWGESAPADIPIIAGARAIVLFPPVLPRTWTAIRVFARLPARLVVEGELSPTEARAWLARLVGPEA